MNLRQNRHRFLYRAVLWLGIVVVATSCSRKKNKWLNRNFHAMGTYYNILYHGNIALENGKEQIKEEYADDYWDILAVERIEDLSDPIEYGTMVESREAVLQTSLPASSPDLNKDEKEDAPSTSKESDSGKQKPEKNDKSPDDAFSDFDNNANNQQENETNNPRGNQQENNNQNNQTQTNQSIENQPEGNNAKGVNNAGNQNQQQGQNQTQQNNQNQSDQNQNMGNQADNQMPDNQGNQNQGGQQPPNQQGGQQPPDQQGGQQPPNQQGGQQPPNQQGGQQPRNQQGGQQPPNQQGGQQSGGLGNALQAQSQPADMMNDQPGLEQQTANFKNEKIDTFSISGQFGSAETKATKAIQKHNMLISGKEYNPQMKDAFLLLGKARYYQQNYFPALEAFNYIINKYEDEEVITSAEIWKEKTYMRLENHERVIDNLTKLLEGDEELSESNIDDITTALAQTYIEVDEKEKALTYLNKALSNTKDKEKQGRYHYIKGQVFEELEQIDSAKVAYDEVIDLKRKSPRIYMIHAKMRKASFFDTATGDHAAYEKKFKKLLKDRENRPFLDIINYRYAEYFKEADNMDKAIGYYNDALRTDTEDHGLKSRIYKTMGDHYFDDARYKKAGAYFDSTMVNLPEASLDYRRMKRKRLSLNDVILYEDIAVENDSILNIVKMSPEEQQEYFENYADSLKTVAIEEAEKAKKEKRKEDMANMFGQQQSQAGSGGQFYFYDDSQVISGKEVFKSTWGDRALEDDWRTERTSKPKKEKEEEEEEDFKVLIENDPAYQAETYLEQIPKDEKVIDSITDIRNFAYYQLGVIYHEKFREHELAADKLEVLMKAEPEERLVLPSKYNLYKIYKELDNKSEMEKWKQDILTNHADSRYAQILENPDDLKDDKNNPIKIYNDLYKRYQAGHYESVIEDLDEYISVFTGNAIIPKMELLKATVSGRLYGYEAYEEGLNYVALAYPQSDEGKKAEKIIAENLPKMAKSEFVEKAEGNYNLIYEFDYDDKDGAEAFKEKLEDALTDLEYDNFNISIDIYSPEIMLVVIKGLSSKKGAEGLGDKLKKEDEYEIDKDYFGISSKNYERVLIHKNLDQYKNEFLK